MNRLQVVLKSFIFYLRANLLVAAGVALSAAVLIGGLIIGDSVSYSLQQITDLRLGKTTHSLTAGDRYFRIALAKDMEAEDKLLAIPVFLSESVAISDGGANRANKVQVVGVDSSFCRISGSTIYKDLSRSEIVISENLAARLSVGKGDNILLRIRKESLVPLNAPFVSNEESSVSFRAKVKEIASSTELGRFSLKNSQSAPYNVFMSINRLNDLMEFQGKANTLLLKSEFSNDEILQVLKNKWQPEDAGLIFRNIKKIGKNEILSERVFLDFPVYDCFGTMPGAEGILTYFVNSIHEKGEGKRGGETPYSFISTLPDSELPGNEIVINRWLADDLNVIKGDSLSLSYFVVGPLRSLVIDSTTFVIKEIAGMKSPLADSTLMPFLPGLADAGSCSEWEAGIPIDLDKIRDKDEAYWDVYRGMPKAFIAVGKAQELWSNRFGNYTSVRFNEADLSMEGFRKQFRKNLDPTSLGFRVIPVKEAGQAASQNGVDFSQLFIGLSFFLLIAAILLSALIFLLNLENRKGQIGTLATLGFRPKQIRNLFLSEGIVISIVGSFVGTFLGIAYTRLVFYALNSLWNDIVRTNVLEIKLVPLTLATGFVISVVIGIIVIVFSIRKILKKQAAEVQKKLVVKEKKWVVRLKIVSAIVTGLISLFILIGQFVLNESQNPTSFFISGTLMLISMLLFADRFLIFSKSGKPVNFSVGKLSSRNLTRNRNRSLSILLLLAIGTFIVISTGANKKDLFSGAGKKTSGTGGFLYFAETTMPVLSNLNNPEYRTKEGLSNNYNVVQFRKMEGDDASCLNLNLISNPAILGVDPEELAGRFTFAAKDKSLNEDKPWSTLNKEPENGCIPAIADQTVIQWGLGKKVGDTLFYNNEAGDTIAVQLVGGLAPSIFQGYIIISNKQFLKNYPSNSGSKVFLINADPSQGQAVSDELNLTFRDYGWEQEEAARRLVEFYSVTNTYLSIFLAMGALALILGTLGMGIVLARSILERKSEIALLQAVGYGKRKIFGLLTREYFLLLAGGVLMGFIAAVVAALPSFLSSNTGVSLITMLTIIAIILLNGIIWIGILSWISLKRKDLVAALKSE